MMGFLALCTILVVISSFPFSKEFEAEQLGGSLGIKELYIWNITNLSGTIECIPYNLKLITEKKSLANETTVTCISYSPDDVSLLKQKILKIKNTIPVVESCHLIGKVMGLKGLIANHGSEMVDVEEIINGEERFKEHCHLQNPVEQIRYVMEAMKAMMDLPVSTTSLENAATMVNNILQLKVNDTILSEVIKYLETLVSKVILPKNQSQTITIKKRDVNIAIASTDNYVQNHVVGIKITSDPDENMDSSIEFLTSETRMKYSDHGVILVNMSSILSQQPAGGEQLSFIVYRNDRTFLNGDVLKKVNSKIISIQMGNISKLGQNEYVDLHFNTNSSKKGNEMEKKECGFWDFGLGPTGQWSVEGCEFLGATDLEGWETCRCYHLTHFAQLITIDGDHKKDNLDDKNINQFHYQLLTYISFYGCILSIAGLLIVAITDIVFKIWKNVLDHKFWMNLVASVGIMLTNFLFISSRDLNDSNLQTCFFSGIILHYSVLSTFSWMFVIACFYYQMTVNMLKFISYSEKSMLFLALAFGWLFPLVPIIPLLYINSNSYSNHLLSHDFCYPTGNGFCLAVFLPIIIFIVCNSVLLCCILYSTEVTSRGVNASTRTERHFVRDIKRFTFLFYQFGLTWIFGLFSKHLVMAYLFCITFSLQGLMLSYIFVLGNRNSMKPRFFKCNILSGEETSYVKSEISIPRNSRLMKKNKSVEKEAYLNLLVCD